MKNTILIKIIIDSYGKRRTVADSDFWRYSNKEQIEILQEAIENLQILLDFITKEKEKE